MRCKHASLVVALIPLELLGSIAANRWIVFPRVWADPSCSHCLWHHPAHTLARVVSGALALADISFVILALLPGFLTGTAAAASCAKRSLCLFLTSAAVASEFVRKGFLLFRALLLSLLTRCVFEHHHNLSCESRS